MTQYLGVKGTNGKVSREPTDSKGYPVELTAGSASIGTVSSNAEGTPGSTKPTKAFQIAGNDGANLRVPYVYTFGIADSQSLGESLSVASGQMAYNGSTWDRWRNNSQGTLLASAARTATTNSSDQTNYNGKGLHVILDVTSAGTGSITLKIEGKDTLSGKYYTLLEGAAVTTNSTNVYKVYPDLTAAANSVANDMLPKTWRITVTANNANTITYSVGHSLNL